MNEDFESQFNNIINENDFSNLDTNETLHEIGIREMVHTLEVVNAASLQISSLLYEAITEKTKFPENAVEIFKTLHHVADQFINETAEIEECDCEECQELEDGSE